MKVAITKLIHSLRTTFPAIAPAEGFTEFDIQQTHLDNFNDSKAKLLDPNILINREAEAELFTTHGFVETDKSPYPTNSVKALWNIAVRVKKIIDNGIISEALSYKSHQLFIETNYNYLDFMGEGKPNSYLLKVVDDTTLKLAKIYLTFLDDVIRDPRALDFLPIVPTFLGGPFLNPAIEFAKKNCHSVCQNLYSKLSDTVKRYDSRKQGQSTLSRDNPVDKIANRNICAMEYCDKLLSIDSNNIDCHKIQLTQLFAQVQDINFEICVAAIDSEISKLNSDTASNIEYKYTPRFSQNPTMEVTYLTTNDFNDDMIFMAIDQKKEALRTAQRNLRNMTSSKNLYELIENRLPTYLAQLISAKIKFYESVIVLAESLQNAGAASLNTDEIINTLFNKLTFLADLTAIENFLTENLENKARLAQIIVQTLAEPFERMKTIRDKVIHAETMIKNLIKEKVSIEIAHAINNDAPTEIKLINSENNDSNELFVIATINQLKHRKENIEQTHKLLQTKYPGAPDECFKKLQDHLFSLKNEINSGIQLLLQLVHRKYVVKPLSFNKIETTDQKSEANKYIQLIETSNQKILSIANFINAEFANGEELKQKILQAIDSNLTLLENAKKMLNAFGNVYYLNQQRQELQLKQQDFARDTLQLKQELELTEQQLSQLAQQADIYIKIFNLNTHIDKANLEYRNMQERKPTLNNQEIERVEKKLTALEKDLEQRRSIPGLVGVFVKSIMPSYAPENTSKELNDIENQITDLKSQLENLHRPMKIFQGACETLQKQIRELESEKMVLSTSSAALSTETNTAFQKYQVCKSKVDSLMEQLARKNKENQEIESNFTQLRNDIITQTKLFNRVLTEHKINLTVILKQLGIPGISQSEIVKMRSDFVELLSNLDIENCAKILESIKNNQDTHNEHNPLTILYADINKNITAIKDCFATHDMLSKYIDTRKIIYDKYFVNNPDKVNLIKPAAQHNTNPLAKSLQSMLRSMSVSPPPPPINTRANYLTRLDTLYREYMNTGSSEELIKELYLGCQNLPFNDLPNGDEVKASFKKFMINLLEEISTIELEMQKMHASLANLTGSNLPDNNYCVVTPIAAPQNTGLRSP